MTIPVEELKRQLVDQANSVPPVDGDIRQAVHRRYRRRRRVRVGTVVTAVGVLGTMVVLSVSDISSGNVVHVENPAGSGTTRPTTPGMVASTVPLPPGVLSRAAVLARFQPLRPGLTVSAKLVTSAALTQADPELTECQVRGCPPGQYVWLILEQGPSGTFPQSVPPGVTLAPGAGAWALVPVNASTGIARGDTEIGGAGQLGTSAWGKLRDLDS
jgi:hypothetical protein